MNMNEEMTTLEQPDLAEQERRWRLILGQRPDQASTPEYWSSDDENINYYKLN